MQIELDELARKIGAELRGRGDIVITGVASLEKAGPSDLSFLYDPRYRKFLPLTRAGAVILTEELAADCPCAALVLADPHLGYARAASLVTGDRHPREAGIHPAAWVSPEAVVDPTASIGPQAVVEAGATIGAGTEVGPGCVVMRDAVIGDHTRLVANVTICHGVRIGNRVLIHPGAVIGGDGFGLARDGSRWVKVPQLGTVRIGDDVEIGCNTTIDRGALDDTVIENGVKLDNQIQIGHNTVVGEDTAMAACTGISGSTKIGKRCQFGGGAGTAGHLSIADDVIITGMSAVTKNIEKPGIYSSGWPAQEARVWRRRVARFNLLEKKR